MALRLNTVPRTNACDAIVDQIDVGGAGNLYIYENPVPSTMGNESGEGDTLLATIVLPATAFGAASVGVATMLGVPLTDTSAAASGTAGHFLIRNGATTAVCDGSCGVGSGDLSFTASADIVMDGTVTINSFTITVPVS